MKKFLLFLLIFAMLLSLIACDGDQAPPDTDPAGTEDGGGEDVMDAKKLVSLSPDRDASAGEVRILVEHEDDFTDITRKYAAGEFWESVGNEIYAYADGVYYEKSAKNTFRAEISASEVTLYHEAGIPVLTPLSSIAQEHLAGVPVTVEGVVSHFTVTLPFGVFDEDVEPAPYSEVTSSKLTVHFNKEYRLKKIECEHTLTYMSGQTYTVNTEITPVTLEDGFAVEADTAMKAYPKLLKEDAQSLIASLTHPRIGDYRIHQVTDIEVSRSSGFVISNSTQTIEELKSGQSYRYFYSLTPVSSENYRNYVFSNGIVYQQYYDDASRTYKKARFSMTQEEFEEALGLGTQPNENADFTDVISPHFSNTLKDVALYEIAASGAKKFSYTVSNSVLFQGSATQGVAYIGDASVTGFYEEDADRLTVTLSFSTQHTEPSDTFIASYDMTITFEGFTKAVPLDIPNASDYPVVSSY